MSSAATSAGILNPRLQSVKDELAREFQEADPFRHVVVPAFFSPDLAERLLGDFPSFEEQYAMGELGEVSKKAARKDVRDISDSYREVDDFLQTPEFLKFMSEITGIPDLLYDPEYVGGGTHENLNGQGLYTHVDFNYHPRGWHRRLNLIVYLSPEWEEEWGGSLELHSNPWEPRTDRKKSVPPVFNQGVIFETSEFSWHGFVPIDLPEDRRDLSRKSFAIYLYTEERPADETAAAHTTVYIPDGMPSDLKPGAVLTPEQHQVLSARFGAYRSMIKAVYDREQNLQEQLDFWRDGHRLELQGHAVQAHRPVGLWPDRWMSKEFGMEFTANEPVRALLLEVLVPHELGSDQVFELYAGDWYGTEEVPAGERRTLRLPMRVAAGESIGVTVHASATFASGPGRDLAYQLVSASLEH